MPFCRCQDVTLYYESHGAGPFLLLVAGLGGGSWSWYGQLPFFEKRYRTIVFDNRGAGRSSITEGPYRMSQLADDARCLLDHLEVEKTLVLGLSMGGMIVQELALMIPQRIQAMFLGCTHAGGASLVPPARTVMDTLINTVGLTQQEVIEKNVPIFFSKGFRETQPEVVAAYCAAQLSAPPQPVEAFRAQLAAIRTFDVSDRLGQLEISTMIVTGSEDVLIPPANTRILAEMLPHAETLVLSGAGHALHAECSDRLNHLADDFFQRHLGAAPVVPVR